MPPIFRDLGSFTSVPGARVTLTGNGKWVSGDSEFFCCNKTPLLPPPQSLPFMPRRCRSVSDLRTV